MFYTIGAILTAIGFFIGIPIAVVLWDFRKYCKDAEHKQIVDLTPFEKYTDFDWLRDYGPLWEPDCTAFWLDPDTEEQRNAWQRKYRPVVNDFDRATLGEYQHFRELTDAQMVKQMAIMAGTTPAMLAQSQAMGSQAYGLMNYQMQKQVQQLEYLQRQNSLWNALFGVRI